MTELKRINVVDRVTSTGNRVQIDVVFDGTAWVQAILDGVVQDTSMGLGVPSRVTERNGRKLTHWAGNSKKPLGVFEDEAAAIETAMEECRTWYRTTPQWLLEKRRSLVADIGYARDEDRSRCNSAWGREDEARAVKDDADGIIAQAIAALSEFDVAHPEIKAAWDTEAELRLAKELENQINGADIPVS